MFQKEEGYEEWLSRKMKDPQWVARQQLAHEECMKLLGVTEYVSDDNDE